MTRPYHPNGAADTGLMASPSVPRHVRPAISVLLQAYDYACGLQRDPWDFAVEMSVLQSVGIGVNEIRWLVYAGLVEHGIEVTAMESESRLFQRGSGLSVTDKTCLVLNQVGVNAARQLADHLTTMQIPVSADAFHPLHGVRQELLEEATMPTWDPDRQELRWGQRVVKRFKLPSPNQETVLTVFQEENWPPRIDDPLPPTPDIDAKRRLNDTIKSLNRHQKYSAVRFMGDGRGLGVRWEPNLGPQQSDSH